MNKNIKKSAEVLLAEIVDYAGLFPPSACTMEKAAAIYAAHLTDNYSWMLGRFVVPVKRLDELIAIQNTANFSQKKSPWKLSVLASEDIAETLQIVNDFNAKYQAQALCDALEIKAESTLQIEQIAKQIPANFQAYFELSLDGNLANSVAVLANNKQRAKIRTGGITPELFPPVEEIMRFMQICIAKNVSFKCTAGLHHPVRSLKPLTYEQNAPKGTMNGFLNVFLAAAFLKNRLETNLIGELLKDENAQNFAFEDAGVTWSERYFISTEELKDLRENTAISFGSCSIDEPIEDLKDLNLLKGD